MKVLDKIYDCIRKHPYYNVAVPCATCLHRKVGIECTDLRIYYQKCDAFGVSLTQKIHINIAPGKLYSTIFGVEVNINSETPYECYKYIYFGVTSYDDSYNDVFDSGVCI